MSVRKREPELPDPRRGGIRPRSPAEMLEPSRAPARPKGGRRRRRESGSFSKWVRFISGTMTVLLLALAIGGMAVFVLQHQFSQPGPLAESRTLIIPRGEGRLEIAERLEREGVIANRWTFIVNHLVRSYLLGDRLDMKAGEFRIDANASMQKVLDTLVNGKSVQYKITIPEGLTSQQIVARLQADEGLTGTIDTIPEEGTLLPDTYPYARGTERQAVLDRMRQAHQDFIEGLWEKRQDGLPIENMQEALILASIVEKETAVPEERAMTAAVFMNRLNRGMRLQSDPTIIYGIVGGRGSLGRPILKSEIRAPTPYNTYTIDRLPPTPICNPGRESILAVLNPAATKALYFVADGTGGHKFSETLAEHNAAVAEWRKIERQRRREEREEAAQDAASPVTTVTPPARQPEEPDDVAAETASATDPPAAPAVTAAPASPVTTVPTTTTTEPASAAIPPPQRKPR